MDTTDLLIDGEFDSLFPPPTDAEQSGLRESLRSEGLREPLRVWRTGGRLLLIDGYARLRLARELGIEVRWKEETLADRDAAFAYRVAIHLERRNLSLLAQAVLRGQLYLRTGGEQGKRTDLPGHDVGPLLTARGIAARFSVSERTIRRDKLLARAVDGLGSPDQQGPEFKALLMAGRTNLTRRGVLQLARMGQDEQQRLLARLEQERKARRERPRRKSTTPKAADSTGNSGAGTPTVVHNHGEAVGDRDAALVTRQPDATVPLCEPTPPAATGGVPPDICLHPADNRKFEWPDIDFCFTDPPYTDLTAYEWLGGMLAKKLRPGRLALVYADGFRLTEQIQLLTAAGLRYVTMFGITYPQAFGGKPLLGFISNNIRPVVLLSQGKPASPGRLVYAARVQDPFPKPHHPWQQAVEPAVQWISRLARPGDLVADPFLGSGTTAVAVRQVGGLRFVGTEIDEHTHDTARQRVATEVPPAGGAEPEVDCTAVEGLACRWLALDHEARLAFLDQPAVRAAIQRLNAATNEVRE